MTTKSLITKHFKIAMEHKGNMFLLCSAFVWNLAACPVHILCSLCAH